MSNKSILQLLSANLNCYQSTNWLKTENERLNGSTPAEMMLENKEDKVIKILPEEIARIKNKPKKN
ncbi:MAG: hypothetical protein CMK37_08365 [Porticoccaceae bacterium]|nr:hypothetical protein [Porticoccaceae bacterium]|tara:strand:+ start:1453 stop:1650 length:198 start_codon:yes stop_codon:yes gene_type:complete